MLTKRLTLRSDARWPTNLIGVAIISFAYSCGFVAWFHLAQHGEQFKTPPLVEAFWTAAVLVYPLSLLLLLVSAFGFWAQGWKAFRGRWKKVLALLAGLAMAWAAPLLLWYWLMDIHLPPLLRHADVSDEVFHFCNEKHDNSSGERVSPKVSRRLARRFPPGSSSRELEGWLAGQDFKPFGTQCKNGVHEMWYSEKDHLVTLDAVIHWKADSAGRVVWTKATVSWMSL